MIRLIVRAAAASLLVGLVVASLGAASAALASDSQAPEVRLAALDADAAHKAVTAEACDKARAALERGKRFRAAGDEVHAKLSDRAAGAWLSAAEDLVRTADSEHAADDMRRGALDAGAQADRERALVEETMLQNGRLRAELDQLEREAKEPPPRPGKQPAAQGDAGARPPRGPAVPAAPGKPQDKAARRDGGAQ